MMVTPQSPRASVVVFAVLVALGVSGCDAAEGRLFY